MQPRIARRVRGSVGFEIVVWLPIDKRAEFVRAFERLSDQTSGSIFMGLRDPRVVLWIEESETRETLEARIASDRFRALLGAAKTLGRIQRFRFVDYPPDLTKD